MDDPKLRPELSYVDNQVNYFVFSEAVDDDVLYNSTVATLCFSSKVKNVLLESLLTVSFT